MIDSGFLKCQGHPVDRTGAQVLAVHFSLPLFNTFPVLIKPYHALKAVGSDVGFWDVPKNKGLPQGFRQEALAQRCLLT